jgi:hypothetical protein
MNQVNRREEFYLRNAGQSMQEAPSEIPSYGRTSIFFLTLTPCFSWVMSGRDDAFNRFNGLTGTNG